MRKPQRRATSYIYRRLWTAAWSPDGLHVAYHPINGTVLFAKSPSGTLEEQIVLQSQNTVYLNDWSPDGRFVIYTQLSPEGRSQLWLLPFSGGGQSAPFLATAFDTFQAHVSPNGKWAAYVSNETGRGEVYVQSFPQAGTKYLVSSAGGNFPLWRRDGRELFYRADDRKLMAVSVRAVGGGLEFGTPTALFQISQPQGQFSFPYDVAPDGQKILALVPAHIPGNLPALNVLINWNADVK